MEELLIEEKAKRYDSMFERLKEMYNNNKTNVAARLICERYFPELKECEENEDERIRKELISLFQDCIDGVNHRYTGSDSKRWLTWLRKQCEIGTNGNERKTSIPEPPLTIKHAKEVMGIKQDYAWSEEDEKCIENAIMYCKWARDIAPNLYCYEISEKSINWLKSLKERYTWKPSDEQMETLENVRKILHADKDIYSKANNLMYNFEELIRTLKKLREK